MPVFDPYDESSVYYTHNRVGRGNSCCVMLWSTITMAVCLSLWSTISYYMGASFCHDYYYRCGLFGAWCRGTTCSGGQWYTTRPGTQDALPEPQNISDVTGVANSWSDPGNGEWDYWSVAVAGIMGPISCGLVLCVSCGTASARSPPAGCVAIVVLTAALMKLACIICLGVQFFTSYPEGQVVYNYFRSQPYVQIEGSLMSYLSSDRYLSNWGGLVLGAFSLLIISCFYELVYGSMVLCCNDNKYSGVSEWETEHVRYARKPSYVHYVNSGQTTIPIARPVGGAPGGQTTIPVASAGAGRQVA